MKYMYIDTTRRIARAKLADLAAVAVKAERQPGIDGVEEGGERLRVGAGDGFAQRVERAGIERGKFVEEIDARWRSSSASPSRNARARATLPSADAAATISASVAGYG